MVAPDARKLPDRDENARHQLELTRRELVIERQADRIEWLLNENARLCKDNARLRGNPV